MPTIGFEELRASFERGQLPTEGLFTPEVIERILAELGREPSALLAAAILSDDPRTMRDYLDEAREAAPDSPAVVSASIRAWLAEGVTDETVLEELAHLKALDPSNALVDYLSAHCLFENGDAEGALAEVRAAALKTHLTDHQAATLPSLESFYREVGCTDSVAKGLALFGMPQAHLGPIGGLARRLAEESSASVEAGDPDRALEIAEVAGAMGQRLSTSGRYLIHDMIGIACEGRVLEAQRRIHESRGDQGAIDRIDERMRNNARRRHRAVAISAGLQEAMQSMDEAALHAYFTHVSLEGEAAALLELPTVQAALAELEGGD